ncbi:MAG: thiamine phosphate synthase [Thermodesulfovibrionales bacterium]|nr:thiamine phosphate synthase [Thermodesulfovibrionales bacterium]
MHLYLITDRKIFNSEDEFLRAVEDALRGGVRMLQMREKDLPDRQMLNLAYRLRDITSRYSARLFVNDRLDIAMIVSADGIHLGQSSIYADVVRDTSQQKMQIGVSTHSLDEALDAQRRSADFITFGPVFDTPSKRAYGAPVGIKKLQEVVKTVEIPVYAIGGIKLENLSEIKKIKPKGVALISGILASEDVYATTRRYLEILGEDL